ncbi:MAG: TldD/PmbA family protein [Treponema sp.]|nr:MAG: TldD/PmbA family protein [Treponema sp.]
MKALIKQTEEALDKFKQAGLDSTEIAVSHSVKNEMNIDAGELSLYRSTTNVNMAVKALKNKRKGSGRTNNLSDASIEKLAQEVSDMASANEVDDANDIAPMQNPESIVFGQTAPDNNAMYDRMHEFNSYAKSKYPNLQLILCVLDFTTNKQVFVNSNGVRFDETQGIYSFTTQFAAKDGDKSSSFNYVGVTSPDLEKPLKDWGNIDEMLRQICEQTETKQVQSSFVGDIILSPQTAYFFIENLLYSFTTESPLITGTSIWKDKLNEQVLSPELTIRCEPSRPSQLKCGHSLFTSDGFRAENETIIENGVLKNFAIGQYGANKTGFNRSVSGMNGMFIQAGDKPKESLVKSVKKGILLGRFSGGQPAANGDFSGVAKNSYLIENGNITTPISETMIAGNLVSILNQVRGVSKDRVDYGYTLSPWIHVSGATISGN